MSDNLLEDEEENRPPNFIPETPVVARTVAPKAKSYPATDLSFVPESQSSPLPGSVLRHLDNRVAESPASGLDDSSFLAPSQQVVPQAWRRPLDRRTSTQLAEMPLSKEEAEVDELSASCIEDEENEEVAALSASCIEDGEEDDMFAIVTPEDIARREAEERARLEKAERAKRERRCPTCEMKSYPEDSVTVGDLHYHKACLKCTECGRG